MIPLLIGFIISPNNLVSFIKRVLLLKEHQGGYRPINWASLTKNSEKYLALIAGF